MKELLYLKLGEARMDKIRAVIVEILRESGAKCGLLIDVGGYPLVRKGFTLIREIEALCTLIVASRATTREIARILGQDEISVVYHQGAGDHIHSIDIGDLAILTILFDDRADLDRIREVTRRRAAELSALLVGAGDSAEPSPRIENLKSFADKALDELLNDAEEREAG